MLVSGNTLMSFKNGILVWYSEIWFVINRIAVMCCSTQQKQKSRVPAAQGSRLPGLRQSRNVTQPQPMEAHTLTRIETYQLHCCFGVETQRTCIWWNLGITCLHTAACGRIISLLRLSWFYHYGKPKSLMVRWGKKKNGQIYRSFHTQVQWFILLYICWQVDFQPPMVKAQDGSRWVRYNSSHLISV